MKDPKPFENISTIEHTRLFKDDMDGIWGAIQTSNNVWDMHMIIDDNHFFERTIQSTKSTPKALFDALIEAEIRDKKNLAGVAK